MLNPDTERGLLGNFARGAVPPALSPPIRVSTSSSLLKILAEGAGGKAAWGGADSHGCTRGWGLCGMGPRGVTQATSGGRPATEPWVGWNEAVRGGKVSQKCWGTVSGKRR